MDEVEDTLPGWYRQQTDPTLLRWWDGNDWTDDVLRAPDDLDAPLPVEPPAEPEPEPEPEEPPRRRDDDVAIPIGPLAAGRSFAGTFGDGAPERAGPERVAPIRAAPIRERLPARDRPPMRERPTPRERPSPQRQTAARRPPERRPVARGAWQPSRTARGRHARRSHTQQLARVAVRAVLVALVAVLAYVLVKPFMDSGGSAHTLATDPRPTTTVATDGVPLTTALLGLKDLPAGWGLQAEFTQSRVGFCGGRNPLAVLVPTEEHHQTFSKGAGGPFIFDLAARYDRTSQAKQLMGLVADTIDTCRTYDENGGQVTLTPLDFPKLGDETFAAHLTGATSTGPLEGDLVWIRKGDRVVSISSVAFGDFDVELMKIVAEKLDQRL